MTGALLTAARKDSKMYVTKGGFEDAISLTTPSGNLSVNVTGWVTKHHFSFDTDGTTFSGQNAHICVDENQLVDLNYPVRFNEEINLKNHKVSVKDSSGVIKNYIVKDANPDETLGLIVCILGDFE